MHKCTWRKGCLLSERIVVLWHELLLRDGEMVDMQLSVGTSREAGGKRVRYGSRCDKVVSEWCVKVTGLVVVYRRHASRRRRIIAWRLVC